MRRRRSIIAALIAATALAAPAPAASARIFAPPPGLGAEGGSGTPATGPTTGPTVPGSSAVLIGNVAYAPANAPRAVKQVIWSANRLRRKPYRYGGGHRSFRDTGYDCSGSVSFALKGGGLLSYPLDSRGFMRWGVKGAGKWITVYANRGHAWAVIAGLRFDTSGPGERGPRWRPFARSTAGFKARHPAGL